MIFALVLSGLPAWASEVDDLLSRLPAPAAVAMGCQELVTGGTWLDEEFLDFEGGAEVSRALGDPERARAAGLDPQGLLLAALSAQAEHVVLQLPVVDPVLFRTELLPKLLHDTTPVAGEPDTWIDADGSRIELTDAPGVAWLQMGPPGSPGPARGPLVSLTARVDPDLGGCWVAVDPGAFGLDELQELTLGGLMVQANGEGAYRLLATGVDLPPEVALTVTGETPPRKLRGTGVLTPDVTARLNAEREAALVAVQQVVELAGRGLPPVVGVAGSLLEDTPVELLPGVEVALGGLFGAEEIYAAVVLPVARPGGRRRLERSVATAFERQGLAPARLGDAWSLDGVGGMEGWWLGITRGALVLATRAALVQDLVDGMGDPWVAPEAVELAARPGVWLGADLSRLPLGVSAVVSAHVGSPGAAELLAEIHAPGLDQALEDSLRGLLSDRREAGGGLPPLGPDVDPVGDPPSTEALAVLMLISSREEAELAETGAYVAYEGGPREIEALDGQSVPWEGIPALGLPAMDTPCRFEVRVDHEGWLASSWCDEDGDGEAAVHLLRPGGTPMTVSPPGVR